MIERIFLRIPDFKHIIRGPKHKNTENCTYQDAALVALIKTLGKTKDLIRGAEVHADIHNKGLLERNPFIASTVVNMYAKCGAFSKANELLEGLPFRDLVAWNALIGGYVQTEHGNDALICFEQLQHEGLSPDAVTFISILKACGSLGELGKGEKIHTEIVRQGFLEGNVALGGALVDMYAKCGAFMKAEKVHEELPFQNALTWSALITGYMRADHAKKALDCFEQMQHEGVCPDAVTYVSILKACSSLGAFDKGKDIHLEVLRHGYFEGNIVLGGALVDMYVKCGDLVSAKELLEENPNRDVVMWNMLIAGFTQKEYAQEALTCFEQMRCEGLSADATTFAFILNACVSTGALDKGEEIHSEIVRQGLLHECFALGNALVNMYATCGAVARAKELLDGLSVRDVVTWNALIAGYAQRDYNQEALMCVEQMQFDGISPDTVTFICILNVCSSIGALDRGIGIHSQIVWGGLLGENVAIGNSLVDMYAKCGALMTAKQVLEGLPIQDVVSWSALIAGYAQGAHAQQAFYCFKQMQCEGVFPNAVTFSCILKACGSIVALEKGKNMHNEIARQGLSGGNVLLGGALLDMYAKCGALGKAKEVLEGVVVRDVSVWNTIMTGYVQEKYGEEALNCFKAMQQEGVYPDLVTFICALKACSCLQALIEGENIHSEIVRQGLLGGNIVLGGSLVDMYAKCGALAEAKEALEGLPVRNVAVWNALLAGCVQEEHSREALASFEQMLREGIYPDVVTCICILRACGSIGALGKGEHIHSEVFRLGLLGRDVVLGGALVDMYAKCGALVKAKEVLEGLEIRNIVVWNGLIAGYAQGEHGREAVISLELMQLEGFSPDGITFLCVLSACSHSGLLDVGQIYLMRMNSIYGIMPNAEHYSCMVNCFGRMGLLERVVAGIRKIPYSNHLPLWVAVLSACKKWGNAKLGFCAFVHAL